MSGRNCSNKGVAWLYSEVCALLDVWADHEIQLQLAGRLHNMCVYDKISKRLMDLGIERTGEQCREKIKKLKRDYKIVVDNNYSAAFARKLLGCYDKVNEIFGKCSVVKPSSVIESLLLNEEDNVDINGVTGSAVDNDKNNDSENDSMNKLQSEISRDSFQECEYNHNARKFSNEHFIDFAKTGKEISRGDFKNNNRHRKRRRKLQINEDMEEILDLMTQRQDELHKKFIALEKKRFQDELNKERTRLQLAEEEQLQNRKHETELFKNLLSLLASKRGVTIDFNEGESKLTL